MHEICKHLSSNFKPKLDIGKACNQSDEFLAATVNNLALSLSVVAEARRLSYLVLHNGRSHSFWLEVFTGIETSGPAISSHLCWADSKKGLVSKNTGLGTIASTPLDVAHTDAKYAGTATSEAFRMPSPPHTYGKGTLFPY